MDERTNQESGHRLDDTELCYYNSCTMGKKLIVFLIALPLLLASLSTVAACTSDYSSNYQTFTLTEGVAHFSFQYPSRYEVRVLEVCLDSEGLGDESSPYSTHVFIGESFSEESNYLPLISVAVFGWPDHAFDYEETIENRLEQYPRDKSDFRLLSREPVTVAGQQGEQIVYSHRDSIHIPDTVDDLKSYPLIVRELLFDYKGQLWNISMSSHESNAEVDKAPFKHILRTLRILGLGLK